MKEYISTIKRKRFEKVASKRVQKVLDAIDTLSNCSNRNSYEYNDVDIQKMMKAIKEKLKQLEMTFSKNVDKTKNNFSF